jgi:hypothetical protein
VLGAVALIPLIPSWADARVPSFAKDVAPILYKNCVSCHRPNDMAASSSLIEFEDARRLARSIKRRVVARSMPPWPADPRGSVKFRNDPSLSQQDIDTLVAWVDAGALRGAEGAMPPPPPVNEAWLFPNGRKPDAVIRLPMYTVKPKGEVPYIQQMMKVPYPDDRWVVAMQMRAGNRRLLHHMGITEVSLPEGMKPGDIDALAKIAQQAGMSNGALSALQPAVEDPNSPGTYDMMGIYTPGTTFEMYGDDSAKLLKGGKNLFVNFNIHYTTTGQTETDSSALALWFEPTPPKHQLFRAPSAINSIISNGRELLTDDPGTKAEGTPVAIPPIPAYASNYELIGVTAYLRPVTIYQFQPHAHMRAKDFVYSVVYPDGHEETVLTVPKYDFHWQMAYQLDQPLTLPAGSKLIVKAHYDNSSKNYHLRSSEAEDPNHQCGPDKIAYFRRQNQSWDEMFSPFIQYSVDKALPNTLPAVSETPPQSPLTTVRVMGCFTEAVAPAWRLLSVGDAAVTRLQATSAAELKSLAAPATTTQGREYKLLGMRPFKPASHVGQTVVVKGVLIDAADGPRLNVTSLQKIAETCR